MANDLVLSKILKNQTNVSVNSSSPADDIVHSMFGNWGGFRETSVAVCPRMWHGAIPCMDSWLCFRKRNFWVTACGTWAGDREIRTGCREHHHASFAYCQSQAVVWACETPWNPSSHRRLFSAGACDCCPISEIVRFSCPILLRNGPSWCRGSGAVYGMERDIRPASVTVRRSMLFRCVCGLGDSADDDGHCSEGICFCGRGALRCRSDCHAAAFVEDSSSGAQR